LLKELFSAYKLRPRDGAPEIKKIAYRYGWTVDRLRSLAGKLGWTRARHTWTEEEDRYIEENIGVSSLSSIARHLGCKFAAVNARVSTLKLSRRPREDYSAEDLIGVFGVSRAHIARWANRGLLGKGYKWDGSEGPHVRFREQDIVRFIREYPQEYDLTRVDQTWFKSMIFAKMAPCAVRAEELGE
jgi:hypothetical protein